jgi:hypothetical protein
MSRPATILMTALAAMTALPAMAGEARFYLAPQYAQTHFSGSARVSGDTGIPPTDFNLEDTLDVDPEVGTGAIEGWVKIFGSRIAFGYNSLEADGETVLTDLVSFDGGVFLPGQSVATDIEMTRYKLLFGYDFGVKVVNAGFLVGAQYIDLSAEMRSALATEQENMSLPVPVVGGSIGIHPLGWLAIHAELTGMSVTVDDIRTKLLDGFAGVDFLLASRVGFGIGYRYFMLDAEDRDEDNAVDLVQRGVYAGVSLHL